MDMLATCRIPCPLHTASEYFIYLSPTNDSTEEAKEAFLEQLQSIINIIPKHDILLLIGDFNAKVGSNNEGHESAMRKQGIGVRNDNGERLLDICEINNLVITGTIFPHKQRHKISWISPDGKTKNQIDSTERRF